MSVSIQKVYNSSFDTHASSLLSPQIEHPDTARIKGESQSSVINRICSKAFNFFGVNDAKSNQKLKDRNIALVEPKASRFPAIFSFFSDLKRVLTTQQKMENLDNFKHESQVFNFTNGAVKRIWAKGAHDEAGVFKHDAKCKYVYYTAISSLFNRKEKELREEVEIMQTIKNEIKSKGGDISNLAIEADDEKAKMKNGAYTVRVRKAEGDFEKFMQDPTTTIEDRINWGRDGLSGIAALHEADYVYGDIKPENNLIYEVNGRKTLRIADFGKTKKIKEGTSLPYKGNTRFASPEGKLSKESDVYGVALTLIRNFEEEIFKTQKDNEKTNLVPLLPDNKYFDTKASSKLRGIERYVVEHQAFAASNPGLSIAGLRNRKRMSKLSIGEKKAQEFAIHKYIEKLQAELRKGQQLSEEQIDKLGDLLKAMTQSNVGENKRITINEALKQYNEIFPVN